MSTFEVSRKWKPCPEPGENVHLWVCYAAFRSVEAGMTDEQAIEAIEHLMTRDPKPNEIEDALTYARGGKRRSSPAWPKVNHEQVEAIIANGPRLIDLWKSSPEKMAITNFNRADTIIHSLYPADALLCVGVSNQRFLTIQKEKFTGLLRLRDFALIVPNPMTAEKGRTRTGKISEHTLANTGPRRFLVIEFDKGTLDQQAALLFHLSKIAPSLALIVFSGSRSLHGWFYCANQSEDVQLRFMRYAVSLGADRATWTRSQFVRMPDGTRRDGKTSAALAACGIPGVRPGKQVALYFNPEIVK